MYLELKIFVVLNGLFSVLELETNRLVLSAPHAFLGLPWAFRLHIMHIESAIIGRGR